MHLNFADVSSGSVSGGGLFLFSQCFCYCCNRRLRCSQQQAVAHTMRTRRCRLFSLSLSLIPSASMSQLYATTRVAALSINTEGQRGSQSSKRRAVDFKKSNESNTTPTYYKTLPKYHSSVIIIFVIRYTFILRHYLI